MSYKPIFHMPIIGPPPAGSGEAPADYYSGLHVTVTARQLDNRLGMEISISDTAHATVYAVCGGVVSFIPAGNTIPSPDNQIAPKGGALVLKAWADDFIKHKKNSPGNKRAASYIYLNVDVLASQIKAAVATVKHRALKKFWKHNATLPLPDDDETLRDFYQTDGVMKGLAWVFVDGGTPLGKAVADNPVHAAKFWMQNLSADGPQVYLSPASTIRAVPQVDPTLPSGRWAGHPLLAEVAKFPLPAEFYLKFTIWNPKADVRDYSPIDNAAVSLIQAGASGDKAIADGQTDPSGVVHLSYPDISKLPPGERKLHFKIDLQGKKLHYNRKTNTLTTFPMPFWSTKKWRSADGVYSLSEYDFAGSGIGTAKAPAEFRVGLDFHVRFRRKDSISGATVQFPQYSHVRVYTRDDNSDAADFVTDKTGAIDGVIYDANPFGSIYFEVQYASIRLAAGVVSRRAYFESVANSAYVDAEVPLLALPSDSRDLEVTNELQSDAIYILQCFEEACALVDYLSPPPEKLVWNGEDTNPIGKGLKLSYWNGRVSVTPTETFDDGPVKRKKTYIRYRQKDWSAGDSRGDKSSMRDIAIFHELGHAVNHWLTLALSELPILDEKSAAFKDGHDAETDSNSYFAFSEGFAAFFDTLFTGYYSAFSRTLFSGGKIQADLDTMLSNFVGRSAFGKPSEENGYTVEGAFAAALYLIVNSHVAGRDNKHPVSLVRTSGDCDVVAANPWLKESGVKERFKKMIWGPFMSLADDTAPGVTTPDTTVKFVQAVKATNPDLWDGKLRPTFKKLHIAVNDKWPEER
jgi:hypothetical protein